MNKKRKGLLIGGGAIVIGAAALLLVVAPRSSTATASSPAVPLGRVTRTTLTAAIESSGSLQPQNMLNLSFSGLGTVDQINVKVGDHVKQGDVLAQLNTDALELQLQQDQQTLLIQQAIYSQTLIPDPVAVTSTQAALNGAQAAYAAALQQNGLSQQQVTVNCANYTRAKNALDLAQTAYDRLANDHQAKNYLNADWGPYKAVVKGLSDAQSAFDIAQASCNLAKGNINNGPVTAAQAQVAQATANLDKLLSPDDATLEAVQAQLEQARLNLQQTQLKLADARIVAPYDGVVTKVNGTRGTAGSGVSIGLADTSRYHLDVLVDEAQITQVQPGQAVEITFDGIPDAALTGHVAHIDPAGQLVQGVINYPVRIDLDPTTAPLRLYLTTTARIIQASHADVLSVPRAAIHTDATTGQTYVEVVDQPGPQQNARRVNVTLGLRAGPQVEVAGDLTVGEYVTLNTTPRRTMGSPNEQ